MLSDSRIRVLVDYPNAAELFPSVGINGGACYFLWDAAYDGPYVTTSDGPYVTYNNGYVAPTYTRPVVTGTYWNDPVGPVCAPGTLVRGLDGRSYLCQ